MPGSDALRQRWRASQRLVVWLLAVWFIVSFGVAFFARDLNGAVFGWPFSFWVAAQGAPLVYLALVCIYARSTRRLDERHGTAEEDEP